MNYHLKYSIRYYSSLIPTIYALSSGQGKCGVAVIRVSGPRASEAILRMTKCIKLPEPRIASLRYIRDPTTLEELDKGLVLWFPGPNSFTGEDSCEFQVHGGPAIIASILNGLSKLPHFKPAEAGDFTKRAFFAGKLDLTEVEGLADLIHAETELQRKQALYQMEGRLSTKYEKWRSVLLKNLAHIEAYIDFSENDNIEDNILQLVNKDLTELKDDLKTHLTDGRRGERLRDGIQAVIIGEPNAGKSSFLNAICEKPVAIVTPKPGTTRDAIQMHLNINGFPVTLVDTAGLRHDTSDMIEKEGILKAKERLEYADLVFVLIDVSKLVKKNFLTINDINTFIQSYINDLELNTKLKNCLTKPGEDILPKCMFIFNKIDLLSDIQKSTLKEITEKNYLMNCISCKTEEGFKSLVHNATQIFQHLCANPSRENPSLTQSRHRHHLNETLKYLNEYFIYVNDDITLAAQNLRISLRHLGKIIGIIRSDDILEIIFKDFCIGK